MNPVSNNSIEDSDMVSDDEILVPGPSCRKRNKWGKDGEILYSWKHLLSTPSRVIMSMVFKQTSFRSVTICVTGE
jgi:hypothetical protein